jgi:hypothetical protein
VKTLQRLKMADTMSIPEHKLPIEISLEPEHRATRREQIGHLLRFIENTEADDWVIARLKKLMKSNIDKKDVQKWNNYMNTYAVLKGVRQKCIIKLVPINPKPKPDSSRKIQKELDKGIDTIMGIDIEPDEKLLSVCSSKQGHKLCYATTSDSLWLFFKTVLDSESVSLKYYDPKPGEEVGFYDKMHTKKMIIELKKKIDEIYRLRKKDHLQKMVILKKLDVDCPMNNCKKKIRLSKIWTMLNKEDKQKVTFKQLYVLYVKVLRLSMKIPLDHAVYCPNKECKFGDDISLFTQQCYTNDDYFRHGYQCGKCVGFGYDTCHEQLQEGEYCARCPCCNATICNVCMVHPYHMHEKCKGYIKNDSLSHEDRKLLHDTTKKCPSCHLSFEKQDGCAKMTCYCGVYWCWDCEKLLNQRDPYKHLCSAPNPDPAYRDYDNPALMNDDDDDDDPEYRQYDDDSDDE